MLHRHAPMHNVQAFRQEHRVRATQQKGEDGEKVKTLSFDIAANLIQPCTWYRPLSLLWCGAQACLQSWSCPFGRTTSWQRWCVCGFSLCSSEDRRGRMANACCGPTKPCTDWTSPNSPSDSRAGWCGWPRWDASPSPPPRSSGLLTSPTWWHVSCWNPPGLSGGRRVMPTMRRSSATRLTHTSLVRGLPSWLR